MLKENGKEGEKGAYYLDALIIYSLECENYFRIQKAKKFYMWKS